MQDSKDRFTISADTQSLYVCPLSYLLLCPFVFRLYSLRPLALCDPLPPNISLCTGSTTSVAHSTTLNHTQPHSTTLKQAQPPLWHRKGLVVTVHTATVDGQVVFPVDQWYRARLLWVEILWVAPYLQLVVAHQ